MKLTSIPGKDVPEKEQAHKVEDYDANNSVQVSVRKLNKSTLPIW
jgi:hypothetical protein